MSQVLFRNYCLILCCSFIFVIGLSNSQETASPLDDVIPDCRAIVVGIVKQHLKAFSTCIKEMKEVTKDNAEIASKMNCAVKCVLGKVGLLNDEKKVTKETVQGFMDRNIPMIYHDIGHDVSAHCYDDFGPQMDHDDEFCHAYGKFVECMQNVVSEIC